MRVLVASDAIGALTLLEAGRIIASGWSTAAVEVLAVGEAGAGFVRPSPNSATPQVGGIRNRFLDGHPR